MDYRKLFAEIHRRPKLYGLDGGRLLTGSTESLVPMAGTGDNLTVWVRNHHKVISLSGQRLPGPHG